ncbi:MAG: hypothetical protein Kow00108_25450 [Calditrichia bacterium]
MDYRFFGINNDLHPKVASFFGKVIAENQLAHAYLFYGSAGAGKEAFAIELAARLLCLNQPGSACGTCESCKMVLNLWHPDLKIIFPMPAKSNIKEKQITDAFTHKAENPFAQFELTNENSFIGIDTIRALRQEAFEQPHQSSKKIIIITDVEKMRVEAANALLKILEEPPPYVIFILVTSNISQILQTIISRCQTIHFKRPDIHLIQSIAKQYLPGFDENQLIELLKISNLNMKKLFRYARPEYQSYLDSFSGFVESISSSDQVKFIEYFQELINSKDTEQHHVFYELIKLFLLDLLYMAGNQKEIIRLKHYAGQYKSIGKKNKDTQLLQDTISQLEEHHSQILDEHHFNSALILQETFYLLFDLFFNHVSITAEV